MTRMREGRVSVVTGANQGLGYALTVELACSVSEADIVYLTARSEARGSAALAGAPSHLAGRIRFEQLDVADDASIERFAALMQERHGGIDHFVSNAAARIAPDRPQSEQVREFCATNNRGTVQLLRAMLPLLRPRGHFVVVASSFGRLHHLPPHLRSHFDTGHMTLNALEKVIEDFVMLAESERAEAAGWPGWINIASKIGQVAAARIAARDVARDRPDANVHVYAVCPGLVDTAASRPWFSDMSAAQSPEQAAAHIVPLLLDEESAGQRNGQLIQFGRPLSWDWTS